MFSDMHREATASQPAAAHLCKLVRGPADALIPVPLEGQVGGQRALRGGGRCLAILLQPPALHGRCRCGVRKLAARSHVVARREGASVGPAVRLGAALHAHAAVEVGGMHAARSRCGRGHEIVVGVRGARVIEAQSPNNLWSRCISMRRRARGRTWRGAVPAGALDGSTHAAPTAFAAVEASAWLSKAWPAVTEISSARTSVRAAADVTVARK